MGKEDYIKRGRNQLSIRLKKKDCDDESVHDLLKLPIEVLYTEALREELYQQQITRNLVLSKRNKELMILNSELVARIVKLGNELKTSR